MINKIYQDSNNMIWVATEDGLNRYDGNKFTIYKNNPADPYSLCNNYVNTIFEDSKGRLFIGTNGGIQIYDPATDKFSKKANFLNNIPFSSNITDIMERKNGKIWVSGNVLFVLEVKGDYLYAKRLNIPVSSSFVDYMFEDNKKNIWLGKGGDGIYRVSPSKKVRHYMSGEKDITITALHKDNKGNIYAGTIGKGLFRYSEKDDSFIPFSGNNSVEELPVKTIYNDNNNTIYIGTDGKGLKTINNGQIEDMHISNNFFDETKSKVHSVLKDKAGNIWLGIYQKGVMLIPAKRNEFSYIGHKSISKNFIGYSCVTSFCRDTNGMLWVGTDNDGIYGIGDGKALYKHFSHEDGQNNLTPPSQIMCLYEDTEHNLWFGSYTKGIATIDKQTGKCSYLKLISPDGKNVQRVFAIVEDNRQRLWIGSMGSGLFYYDMKSKKVEYPEKINQSNGWINCILLSKNNKKLYTGTFYGINSIDIDSDSNFSHESFLGGLIVYTLYEGADGMIWAGTTQGLIQIDTKNKKTVSFTIGKGLAGNYVYAIRGDENGNLWISTNSGISHFNIKTHHFINYYAGDGLQGNEFYKNASMKDKDGTLWFGGINGITYFNPKDIVASVSKMNIRITDFYINNKPVRKGTLSDGKGVINCPIFDAKDFYLGYRDNSFSIEFSCMEMNSPERMKYMYSLDGKEWIDLPAGTNRASLIGLSPGTYTFRVKAVINGEESNTVKINIHIAQPWWRTNLAYFIYFLIISLTVSYIVRNMANKKLIKQKMLENKHTEDIKEAKLQFFINISHEIRTPMSLIMSPLQRLIETDDDSRRQKLYYTIYNSSQKILQLINQLIDIQKFDKGRMILSFSKTEIYAFVSNICDMFIREAEMKGIKITLHNFAEQKEDVWIDPAYFDKIIINLLSNALKFTPANGHIDLYISKVEDKAGNGKPKNYIEIIVSDNGIGISPNDIGHIFERFYQARARNNGSINGTGIGLHLTKLLVELHHATISVESNTEHFKGTKFIVRLPMGKSHLREDEIDKDESTQAVYAENNILVIHPYVEKDRAPRASTRYKVLIVDDDNDIRKYLSNELSTDFHITETRNGKEALSAIFEDEPDLVLSDVMMDEMDGFALCRNIKQNASINNIPVILLTARVNIEDNLDALKSGADAYITKPFNINILKETIFNLIYNRKNIKAQLYHEKESVKLKAESPDELLMKRIMRSINNNISNSNFTIDDFSKDVGISRVHLHRKLKELTNQTTRDFIRNIRLKQAATLLSEKKYSINEIAKLTGFSNANNFSTLFKELYGQTPTEYMEKHLKN